MRFGWALRMSARHGHPYYQVHRVDLHAALMEAVTQLDPQALQLGYRAVRAEEDAQGATVHFEDGRQVRAELLVGSDGIKSVVRRHVVDAEPPVFTGQVAWRLAIPIERIEPALRPPLVSSIWCGPNNHAVMYYMRSGQVLNFVGCVERPWEEESWTSRQPWEELDQDYAGWHPMVRAAIDNVDRDQCYRWALNNRKPVMTWCTGRVALLGDAVHPTLPYMAQGAAMALEDAFELGRSLQAVQDRIVEVPVALQRYALDRWERVARVQRRSLRNGAIFHATGPMRLARNAALRSLGARLMDLPWLYGH